MISGSDNFAPDLHPPALGSDTITTSTKPGRQQIIIATAFSFGLIIVGVVCTPIADLGLVPVPGFMTAFGAGMLVINALLAALLLSKGAIEQRADVMRLGAAYFFVAAIFVPLTLSFKDGFVPGALIGTAASSVWLWSAWHAGFGLLISWYALRANSTGRAISVRTIMVAVIAAVSILSVIATAGVNYLPALLWNGSTLFPGVLFCIPVTLMLIDLVAVLCCLRLKAQTTEQLWVTVALVAACFDLWLTVHGGNRFALGWYLSKCGSFITSFVVIASLFHDISGLYRNSARANRVLTELAHRDGLTGVFNRRYFDEKFEAVWRQALRDRAPLSLLIMDVDFFKQYNDQYGHVIGDDCLRTVAGRLTQATAWPGGVVSRYGGEEFAVLLPNTSESVACEIAETLRASIESLAIPHKHNPHGSLTISAGVSTQVPLAESRPQSLLRRADAALYLAKHRGRNGVASSSEISHAPAGDAASFERRAASA